MKKLSLIAATALLLFTYANVLEAQDKKPFRAGFQLQEMQGDFGLGVNFDVPLPGWLPSLRLAGNWHWLGIPGETSVQTASFQSIRLGIAPDGWQVAEKIRVYGEGGALFLLTGSDLSPEGFSTGGYGLFGFEFFTEKINGSSLFLEVGGTAAGRRLDRLENIPAFGAGMLLGAGFRVSFSR